MNSEKGLATRLIPIVRMDCPSCIPVLEKEIKRLVGVNEVRANYMTKTLKVVFDPDLIQISQVEAAIERLGCRITYKKYPSVVSKLKGLFRKEKPRSVRVISDSDFAGKVLHASKPVAVLFSSPTCPTCQVLKPVYMEAAEDLGEKAELYEMDISSSEIWRRYDVLTVPTILVFRKGEVKHRLGQLPEKAEIEKALSA